VVCALGFVAIIVSYRGVPAGWESSKAVLCDGKKSFAQISELYNFEKNSYSDQAQSFKVYLSNGEKLRVIFDYFKNQERDSKYEYQLSLYNIDQKKIALKDFRVVMKSDGAEVGIKGENVINIEPGEAQVISATSDSRPEFNRTWKLLANSADGCLFKLSGVFGDLNQQKRSNKNRGVVVGSESGSTNVPPGFSLVGFTDWRTVKPFADLGIRVLSFNREKAGAWNRIEGDPRALFEPGIAYYLENPGTEIVTVEVDEPYKVATNISSHSIRPGWNLLYNDSGKDLRISDYRVTIGSAEITRRSLESRNWLVSELSSRKLISNQSYTAPKFQSSAVELSSLDISQTVKDGDSFWVYLFEEPDIEQLSIPELEFELKSDKDSYKSGEQIRINYKITNNSNRNYAIDGENQSDPCMYGFAILKGSKTLYSSIPAGITSCPSWPEQIDLQAGSVIEYNQSWKVPERLSGQLRLVGYFDQSRVFSKDMKLKQIVVNIEEDE